MRHKSEMFPLSLPPFDKSSNKQVGQSKFRTTDTKGKVVSIEIRNMGPVLSHQVMMVIIRLSELQRKLESLKFIKYGTGKR